METPPVVPLPSGKDLRVVRRWAEAVLAQFGLEGWSFAFTWGLRTLGVCRFRQQCIGLSVHLIERNALEEVRETLLHEVAHALVGAGHGHGPAWQAMARRVGARPERCGEADMPQGRWRARCGGCGEEFRRHRRPARVTGWFCQACGRDKGRLVWRPDGDEAA